MPPPFCIFGETKLDMDFKDWNWRLTGDTCILDKFSYSGAWLGIEERMVLEAPAIPDDFIHSAEYLLDTPYGKYSVVMERIYNDCCKCPPRMSVPKEAEKAILWYLFGI